MPDIFGATTDHFSLASETLILIKSSKKPRAKNRADALDEKGDLTAMTHYGDASTMFDCECEYVLKSGTLNINTIKLGYESATLARTGLEATTSNTDFPHIKVTGVDGCIALAATELWTPSSITLTGAKTAQLLGCTIAAGTKLTGSSYSLTVELAEVTNGVGVPIAHALSCPAPARLTATGVAVTAAGDVTWSIGTEVQEADVDEPQAGYGDWTSESEVLIGRDAEA